MQKNVSSRKNHSDNNPPVSKLNIQLTQISSPYIWPEVYAA